MEDATGCKPHDISEISVGGLQQAVSLESSKQDGTSNDANEFPELVENEISMHLFKQTPVINDDISVAS